MERSGWPEYARFVSNWINPALAVWWLIAIVSSRRRLGAAGGRFFAAGPACVALCVFVVHAVRALHLRPHHPLFPSGHEAFAASAACVIVQLCGQRAWPALILAVLLGPALVIAGYHDWADVTASFVICVPLTLACHAALAGRRKKTMRSGA